MSSKDYRKGRDDFEYAGGPSPPRCDRGDTDCRRSQRDYEDGFRAAEREREEARVAKRIREEALAEKARWQEQEHRRQLERDYYERQLEEQQEEQQG